MVRFHRWSLILLVLLLAIGAANARRADAKYNVNPPAQPGFPAILAGAYIDESSPTLADLNGDGKQEIIIGGRDLNGTTPGCGGWVYAYRSNGALLWQTHVRAPV